MKKSFRLSIPCNFANDVGISKAERFDAYKDKIVRHTPHQVIQKPDIIFETLK